MVKRAYFGDTQGWCVYGFEISEQSFKIRAVIPTGFGAYPVDRIGPKSLLAITRGERSVTWIDLESEKPLGQVELTHKPRSATSDPDGLVLISGADQARTSVFDSHTRRVRLVVGDPSSDLVEDFGGSLASGHEQWLPITSQGVKRFFVIDRTRRKIQVYRFPDGNRLWSVNTPSSVHHVVQDRTQPALWYALCEGNPKGGQPPAILCFEVAGDSFQTKSLSFLPVEVAHLPISGGHHIEEHPASGKLYIGSNEGYVYVLDKHRLDAANQAKKISTGSGCGHTRFTKFDDQELAVMVNHSAQHVSVIDTRSEAKVADIKVTSTAPPTAEDKTQGHTTFIYPDQPHLFYVMASLDATLWEIDLRQLCVARSAAVNLGSVDVSPRLLQGVFI